MFRFSPNFFSYLRHANRQENLKRLSGSRLQSDKYRLWRQVDRYSDKLLILLTLLDLWLFDVWGKRIGMAFCSAEISYGGSAIVTVNEGQCRPELPRDQLSARSQECQIIILDPLFVGQN